MSEEFEFPPAIDPSRVGTYPALSKAGGGYVWDAVLEYRVWYPSSPNAVDDSEGGDQFEAFATYEDALDFARATDEAADPLALVLQEEYIDETQLGLYVHVRERRVTEWPVTFLRRPRRTPETIPAFISSDSPDRLDRLRGLV